MKKKIIKSKKINIILFTLALLLFITSFIIPAVSRYVAEINAPFNDNGVVTPTIDYTVNAVFEVKTQEELFAAINQGYSYIQISKDVENPLIVTQEAETLDRDMILDLNGIEIQRNGTDPILNIGPGVRLTVTDTSDEQTGGLYNPIGSVFNITGGTLTVVTGNFESGPRYSEYYSYNTSILQNADPTQRTVVEPYAEQVIFHNQGEEVGTAKEAPIIKSYPTASGEIVYNHGNLYFDHEVSLGDHTIYADTYCYYRTSEQSASLVTDPATADWYYTYYVMKDTYTYYSAELLESDSEEDYVKITIYGYENTIQNATEKTQSADENGNITNNYYAAIRMQSGLLEVNDGNFFSYFGVDTTACVNATGGAINIKRGDFSSRIPNADYVSYNAITEKENDILAFDSGYFDNFEWNNTADSAGNDGGIAESGESFCILNAGQAAVSIGYGNFYSSNNNIIKMSNGSLSIGGGDFTKTNTIALSENTVSENAAAILMQNGELTIDSASYTVTGDYTKAIHMTNGKMTISNSDYSTVGDNTYGIFSTVTGAGNFIVKNTDFTLIKGSGNIGKIVGIYAQNGEVQISSDASATLYIDGNNSKGIFADGGSVSSTNYTYNILGDSCSGIYSADGIVDVEGGDITLSGDTSHGIYSNGGTISLHDGNITLTSNNNCYGIYAWSLSADIPISVNAENANIDVGYDSEAEEKTGTVDASIGVFLASLDPEDNITLTNSSISSYELGISLSGGKLDIYGTGTINTNRASAIAVDGGALTFHDGSNYTIVSNNTRVYTGSETTDTLETYYTNSYGIRRPILQDGAIIAAEYDNLDGIRVDGGSLLSNGSITLTHTGLTNDPKNDTTYNYTSLTVTSYAIRVEGGSVDMLNGTITSNIGGGIYCSGGNITMGKNGYSGTVSVRTDGEIMGDSYNAIGSFISNGWTSNKSITGGHAIELEGGDITIHYGSYEADFGNGIMANGSGTINVYSGSFFGWMGTGTNALSGRSGPSSYYGLKVIGGATVNIYGGTFNGGNGGAFVTGITSISDLSGSEAQVRVYAGTFGGSSTVDAFNVYDLSNVVFGAHPSGVYSDAASHLGAITMNATSATIAANAITNNSSNCKESTIDIYYGSYNDGSTGGVYNFGNATITAYNTSLGYTTIGGSYTDAGNTTAVHYGG